MPQRQESWFMCQFPGLSVLCIKQLQRGKAFLLCKHHPCVLHWEPAHLHFSFLPLPRNSSGSPRALTADSLPHRSGQGWKQPWFKVTCILCKWSLIIKLLQRGGTTDAAQDMDNSMFLSMGNLLSCTGKDSSHQLGGKLWCSGSW